MQFLLFSALLGLAANAAVIDERSVAPAAELEERSIEKRATLSALDLFTSSGCSNYQTTVFVTGNPGGWNGPCFGLGTTVPSVKTTSLYGSCTCEFDHHHDEPGYKCLLRSNLCIVTVYTDKYCTNGATAARVGKCLSGSWKSFSTDNC